MLKNEAIQAVEENISVFFFKFGVGKGFLTLTQNPEAIKKELINLTTKKKHLKIVYSPKHHKQSWTNAKVQENICNIDTDKTQYP